MNSLLCSIKNNYLREYYVSKGKKMPRSLLITEYVDKDIEGRILKEN